MIRKEIRFYVTMLLGYALLMISLFTPPVGVISTSVLYASGMFLILSGATIGIDIPSIIKEIRLLRSQEYMFSKELGEDDKDKK